MGLLCFPEFVCQGLKHALHFLKKNSTGGVKTAPAALQNKKKDLLTRPRKPPNPRPHPYTVAFRRPSENWAGAPQCFGYGDGQGDFFNSA